MVLRLLEFYQNCPVFAGLTGRPADVNFAGAGYLGFCAGLKLAAGSRIVPLDGKSG
jgi:hypothetical protein